MTHFDNGDAGCQDGSLGRLPELPCYVNVRTALSRLDRLRNCRDLNHHFRADIVGLLHEVAWIPKSIRESILSNSPTRQVAS